MTRFTSNINESMKSFVICRHDTHFGERALYNLIELFLNPDSNTIGGDALESATEAPKSDVKDKQSDLELLGILTADKLIRVIILLC